MIDSDIKRTLFRAVGAVYLDNRRLIQLAIDVRSSYIYDHPSPVNSNLLSEALRCEKSKAHQLLEEVFSALKRFQRGKAPKRVVEYWLRDSSYQLLKELRKTAESLPGKLSDSSVRLCRAIDTAGNLEFAITNLVVGDSGSGDNITHEQYAARLDRLLSKLKKSFNAISGEFASIELLIFRSREDELNASNNVHKRHQRREKTDAEKIKQKDFNDISREVNRRCASQAKHGVRVARKQMLKTLYDDEAWSRRCHQWSFETLYNYISRRRQGVYDANVTTEKTGLIMPSKQPENTQPTGLKTTQEVSPETTTQTTIETTMETTIETTIESLSEGEKRVYDAICSMPTATLAKIAECVGMTRDGVFYHVKALRKEIGLRHEGSTKKGRWVFISVK